MALGADCLTNSVLLTEEIRELDNPDDSPTRGRSKESKPLNRRRSTLALRGHGRSQSMIIGRSDHGIVRARSEERRLGVRRALDLAGSTIVAYNNNRSSLRSSNATDDQDIDFDEDDDWDEIDEFKATVVLEQMIRAADVAALLQDWNNVMKWSTRLYKELKNGLLEECGSILQGRIVGGSEAESGEYPWHVGIRFQNTGTPFVVRTL